MFNTPAGLLALVAIVCFGAAMVPSWPEKYLAPAAGIFLAVALLVGLNG